MLINTEQRLYVFSEGRGYSCLGFDVVEDRITRYAAELGVLRPPTVTGTLKAYQTYQGLICVMNALSQTDGRRFDCDLTPQLIGLDGKRVEVVDRYGERRRFWVGRSTGLIPIHLEVSRRPSYSGYAVTGAPFKSVRIIR